ncbi:TonB-dependent receptor [Asticcacaulis sp. AC402]|uniref:TonB-dependent receptor n=1 Tax=Asticcacaulis sp. AC402 TaxID=1282361 RepID=UPI0003C40F86|nr:TonB-dependent receptor [Asticcacaulis sp. AC402]ESQ75745.1 TonB-denpendent receptor [Asticcacaulis sp. AC402]
MKVSKGHSGALRARLLTCGAAAAILTACAFTAPAMAQDAPAADDTTTVVVTGIRRGIQDAISVKKRSSQIVEAVSAEDIGKLPDASIAESIARLPGIAAQRTNGRAQSLSIRGLGPDYTVTTLNGREQVSTSDNRSVEFDQYPSELISQVLVYKTPNAGMVSQGLAGTADLLTVRPLAYGRQAAAINLRGELNSEEAAIGGMSNSGNRFSAMYIDQFMDGKVGLALGFAHTDSPYQVQKKEPWGDGGYPTCGAPPCLPADANKLILGGEKDGIISSNLTRDGFMGVLEFKPNDQLHITIDAYHSDFRELQKIARLEYPLRWSGATLQPGYTAGNNFITKGVFTGVKAVVENYTNEREAKLDSVGFNVDYELNDKWTLVADVAMSKVVRDDLILESTAGTGPSGSGATDTITFSTPDNYGLSTLKGVIDYSNFDTIFLTDPGGWGGPANRAGYVKAPHIEDELTTIKAAATRRFDDGFFSSVSFGANQTNRTKDKKGVEGFISLKTGPAVVVPTKYRMGVTDAAFLGGVSGMISYDGLAMWKDGFFNFTQDVSQDAVKKTWNVDETVTTLFVKADIDSELFGVPLTGNIGLMHQKAEQTSTSAFTDGTATGTKIRSESAEYDDLLPSVSLNFAVAEDMTLRIGAGTTLVRPRMDDMAAGIGYGPVSDSAQPVIFNGQQYYWSGGGGNPGLKPWKANAFDMSLEKYFGRKGYVSAAIFHKDLTSYIFNQTILRDYSGVPLTNSNCFNNTVFVCTQANTKRTGTVSVMQNGSGGWIKGIELSASIPGEMIWDALDGFGLVMSAASNDSEINPSGTNPIQLPGLSEKVINTTVYYENHGFSARISNRYRGEFLGEVPDYTNSLQSRYVAEESLIDAQVSYEFQDGTLQGLTLSFSGTNLTNEPFVLYTQGNPANIMRHEIYGSTYLFGVNYKF